ncbi:MAG: DUF927 domain-containing protein [Candidatus Riflebacteria bacterium]|nr:DUF927 domain-containing protein [Candidatus Riflebacteria bacterium]
MSAWVTWPDTGSQWQAIKFFSPEEAWKISEHAHKFSTVNHYFGACTRDVEIVKRSNPKGTGKSDSIIYVSGFYADIDVGTNGHSAKGYAPTKEVAIEIMGEMDILPTYIVDTGGGFHGYRKLAEGIFITSEDERLAAEHYLKRFHAFIASKFAKHGFKIDNVSDLARVMRVPGSFNHKREVPELVEIIHINSKNIASLDDWEEYLPAIEDIGDSRSGARPRSDTDTLMGMVCQCDFIQYCADNAEDLPEPLWYAMIGNVSTIRPGGINLCHALSREHPGYTKSATDAKIEQANDYPPHTCEYIRTNGFDCPRQCRVKSPAGLFSKRPQQTVEPSPTPEPELDPKECFEKLSAKVFQNKDIALEGGFLREVAELKRAYPGEYESFFIRIKSLGVPVSPFKKALKAVEAKLPRSQADTTALTIPFLTQPVKVPRGYVVSQYDVKTENGAIVCTRPLIVSGIGIGLDTGCEQLEVAFKRDDGWVRIRGPRQSFMNSGMILALADQGFPVSSSSGKAIVQYLELLEAENWHCLPKFFTVEQMGWIGNKGDKGFLAGNTWINHDGEILDKVSGNAPNENSVTLSTDQPGLQALAAGMTANGSYEAWLGLVDKIKSYPIVVLSLLMSFIPPLRVILPGVENLIFHMFNATSSGKTTALALSASVWGNPARLIQSWNNTSVYIERLCAASNYLPVYLDEVKQFQKLDQLGGVIFMIGNGSGRGRGNIRGTQQVKHWQNLAISTGEFPITSFVVDGGGRARCLETRGAPFVETSPETTSLVNEVRETVTEHHGHAGVKFVRYLCQHRAIWPEITERFLAIRKRLQAEMQTGFGARLAGHLAVIEIVAELLQESLDLTFDMAPVKAKLQEVLEETLTDVPVEVRALRYIGSWAMRNEHRFVGRVTTVTGPDYAPGNGYAGVWSAGPDWETISFYPDEFEARVKHEGFENKQVLNGLRDRHWIKTSEKDRFTTQVTLPDSRPHMIVIKREAFEKVGVIEPEPSEKEQLDAMFPPEQ